MCAINHHGLKSKVFISFCDRFLCLSDIEGNVVLEPNRYVLPHTPGGLMMSNTTYFREGVMPVATLEGSVGYINTSGNEVLPFIYESAYPFFDGLAVVKQRGKWGMINRSGAVCVPFLYDAILYRGMKKSATELICASITDNFGYITSDGKLAIPFVLDNPIGKCSGEFKEGVAPVVSRGEKIYIDRNGKRAITPCENFDYLASFEGGYAQVLNYYVDRKIFHGYIDSTGNIAVPIQYEQIGCRVSDGVVGVAWKGKKVYTDNVGRIVLETSYDDITEFSGGVAWGKRREKWESFNRKGEVLASNLQFDSTMPCDNGYWITKQGTKYGYIDIYGNPLVEAKEISPCPYCNIDMRDWIQYCLTQ